MSNRLNVSHKEHIVSEESSAKFRKPLANAEQKFKKLLEEEVKKIVASRFKVTDEMLHSGYITTSCNVSYKVDDEKYHKSFSINSSYPSFPHSGGFAVTKTNEIDKARKEWLQLKEDQKKFEAELKSILYGFTTKSNLVENIPEFEIYFKNEMKMSKALVPMTQIVNIRKQLTTFDITKKKAKSA